MLSDLLLVLVLVLVNGLLAGSELAVVSSRRPRLESMARRGVRGAAAAIDLADDPGRLLSTIQIGITLVGVLAGAAAGPDIGAAIGRQLATLGIDPDTARTIGVGGGVALITYLSVVVGELAPKRIALRDPEGLACAVAPLLQGIARAGAAPIWLLDRSADLLLAPLGDRATDAALITEDEVLATLSEADAAGVLEPGEQQMLTGVLRLGDRRVSAVLTPRTAVEVLDLSLPPDELVAQVRASPFSRFPAHDGAGRGIVGVIDTKRLVGLDGPIGSDELRGALLEPPELPETVDARDALLALQRAPVHMAVVYDEYGSFAGIVTATDILEAIVGEFVDEDGNATAPIVPTRAGWEVRARVPAADVAEVTGLPVPADHLDDTLGGFVLAIGGRVPEVGDVVEHEGWRLVVATMSGRRIEVVQLLEPTPRPDEASEPTHEHS